MNLTVTVANSFLSKEFTIDSFVYAVWSTSANYVFANGQPLEGERTCLLFFGSSGRVGYF